MNKNRNVREDKNEVIAISKDDARVSALKNLSATKQNEHEKRVAWLDQQSEK